MPASVASITASITPSLVGVGLVGFEGPRVIQGVANGLSQWVPQIVATTIDVGLLGTGVGGPVPLVVPSPVLLGNLTASFAAQGLLGTFVPAFVNGLANGFSLAFSQMLIQTTHPTVGSGSGILRLIAPPATASMLAGLSSAGVAGISTPQLAAAIGVGLDLTLVSLVLATVIAGPASPFPSTGVGIGNII